MVKSILQNIQLYPLYTMRDPNQFRYEPTFNNPLMRRTADPNQDHEISGYVSSIDRSGSGFHSCLYNPTSCWR